MDSSFNIFPNYETPTFVDEISHMSIAYISKSDDPQKIEEMLFLSQCGIKMELKSSLKFLLDNYPGDLILILDEFISYYNPTLDLDTSKLFIEHGYHDYGPALLNGLNNGNSDVINWILTYSTVPPYM